MALQKKTQNSKQEDSQTCDILSFFAVPWRLQSYKVHEHVYICTLYKLLCKYVYIRMYNGIVNLHV